MTRQFRSKVDSWFYLALAGVVFALLFSGYTVLVYEPEEAGRALPLLLVAAAVALGLPAWLLSSTAYTLETTQLVVRSGPFSWRIPLADIRRITPTRNPLSSPALSLDRLLIEYGNSKIMISPADKDGFLRAVDELRSAGRSTVPA